MKAVAIFLAVVACCLIQFNEAKVQRCVSAGGVCKKDDGSCRAMQAECPRGLSCCEQAVQERSAKRKCKTKKKCSKNGGTCINPKRGDLCYAFGVDSLCKGASCKCCLRDYNRCRSTPKCKFQGGICVSKRKSSSYCEGQTIDRKGCKGKKCVCCIPESKSCLCGIENEAPPTTSTSAPKTTNPTTPPPNPWKPWKPKSAVKERITGGVDVMPRSKYPWVVGLSVKGFNVSDYKYFCIGAIINTRYILTTASCLLILPPGDIEVGVADYDQTTTSDDLPGITQMAAVSKVISNPDYNGDENDIALLQLENPLDLISHKEIKPVCLPQDDTDDFAGDTGVIAGWGNSNFTVLFNLSKTPREVDLEILPTNCNGIGQIGSIPITDNLLCAGLEKDKAPCVWDFGGPLTVKKNGRHVLAGMFAIYNNCGSTNLPAGYTRVSKYLDWITKNIGSEGDFCG